MQEWIIEFLIVVIVLLPLIIWHAKTHVYKCPKCGFIFKISLSKDFLSPHLPGKKLLRCPSCGHKEWAKEFRKNG